jgi:hypothetical protein
MNTPAERGGAADVVYLLLLLQIGFGLLAMLGELLFMANPLYLLAPVAKAVALFVVAVKVVSGRRWAWITALVFESIGLIGFWLSLMAGLLPMLSRTVTFVGLLTEIAIPVTVIYLAARMLITNRRPRPGRPHPRRQDPVDPWPQPLWTDGLPQGWPQPLPQAPSSTTEVTR